MVNYYTHDMVGNKSQIEHWFSTISQQNTQYSCANNLTRLHYSLHQVQGVFEDGLYPYTLALNEALQPINLRIPFLQARA